MKHMKHLAIALLMVFTLMLTGCVRLNVELTIKDDGTADVSMLYAVMSDIADEGTELSEEEKNEILAEGGEYASYNEDGYVGYTITMKDLPVENLGSESGLGEVSNDMNITQTEDGYRFESTLFGGDNAEDVQSAIAYLDTYGGYMKFTLHLPEPAKSSNATSVEDDGKTLIWDVAAMDDTGTLYAEFNLPKSGSKSGFNAMFIIIGLVAVAAIVAIIILATKKKKTVVSAGETSAEYVFCTNCGAKLVKGTAFCTNCGTRMVETPAPADDSAPAEGMSPATEENDQ